MEMQTRGAQVRSTTRNVRYEAHFVQPAGIVFCEGVHPELGQDDFYIVLPLIEAIDYTSDR